MIYEDFHPPTRKLRASKAVFCEMQFGPLTLDGKVILINDELRVEVAG